MKQYNRKFLRDTLYLIKSELDDLCSWSAYNDDKYNEEIINLKEDVTKLVNKAGGLK